MTEPLDTATLDALQEAEAAMTPGPWVKAFGDAIFPPDSSMPVAWTRDMGPDIAGIVLLRNNAAALLDAARRERALEEGAADVNAERDMYEIAYRDLRKAAQAVVAATQPTDRDEALLDLASVIETGDLRAALAPTDSAGSPVDEEFKS